MEKFPSSISDPLLFEEKLDEYNLQKLRKKVYFHILHNNQNDFFDIELFNRIYVKNMQKTEDWVKLIIMELQPLGWKTFIGYGGTGLFFYDNEKPANAW